MVHFRTISNLQGKLHTTFAKCWTASKLWRHHSLDIFWDFLFPSSPAAVPFLNIWSYTRTTRCQMTWPVLTHKTELWSMLLWSFSGLWDVPAFWAAFCQLFGIKSFLAHPCLDPEKWKGKNLLSSWNYYLQWMQSWGENRRPFSDRATVEMINNRFTLLNRKNH